MKAKKGCEDRYWRVQWLIQDANRRGDERRERELLEEQKELRKC